MKHKKGNIAEQDEMVISFCGIIDNIYDTPTFKVEALLTIEKLKAS